MGSNTADKQHCFKKGGGESRGYCIYQRQVCDHLTSSSDVGKTAPNICCEYLFAFVSKLALTLFIALLGLLLANMLANEATGRNLHVNSGFK